MIFQRWWRSMSRGVLLDIMALYKSDPTLFDTFTIPTTITYTEDGTEHTENIPYTKEVVVNNICLECAELEVLYPDADYFKIALGAWSQRRLYTWQRIADVLYRKYDPFINVRRHEQRSITETRNLEKGETRNLAGTNDVTAHNNVNAYNDSTANGVQRGQVVTDQDTTDTGTINTTDTGTVTTIDDFHLEGDSAIRDAQDIIRLEVQVRLANDLIEIIIEDFKKRFCLGVY